MLRAALNHAFHDGKVSSDLEWRKVKPFKKVDAARLRYLTIAEAKRLINAAEPDFRLLVQAALQTGARYGELARLTVGDFNPDVGTVSIQQSKSGKSRHVVLTDEGVKFFRRAVRRPSRRRNHASQSERVILGFCPSDPTDGRNRTARKDRSADLVSRITPHVG